MKTLVSDSPVDSAKDLIARIAVAAEEIRDMPGVFQNVRISMSLSFEVCIVSGERNFESLLCHTYLLLFCMCY